MNLYLTENCKLTQKDKTLHIKGETTSNFIPIENINKIYILGNVDVSYPIFVNLSKHNITTHYYDKYSGFLGTYYPKEAYANGKTIIEQVNAYNNSEQRQIISLAMLEAGFKNINKNIKYYIKNGKCSNNFPLKECLFELSLANSANKFMLVEAKYRKIYYSYFADILSLDSFTRQARGANDITNRLITFLNALLYTQIEEALSKTGLNSCIGFLHASNRNKLALIYDIADIFKPLFVDRLVFSMINKKEAFKFDDSWFSKQDLKYIIAKWDKMLDTTFFYPERKISISHKTLLEYEVKKLERCILKKEQYKPFVSWW